MIEVVAMIDSELLEVKIVRRTDEAEEVISLELRPVSVNTLPAFEAGSHVDIHVAPGLVRQYSLCNNPRETHRYVLGVLREPQSRGGSEAIHSHFQEGLNVWISRPRNNFHLVETAAHSILAGGGIGVTPILAMAWRLWDIGASFELHYCTRSFARTAFGDLLKSAPFADKIFLHLDDGADEQRFKLDRDLGTPAAGIHLYACGPGGFMDYVIGGARRLGWAEPNIHVEFFTANIDVSGNVFSVRLARSGLDFVIPADKTIAEVLLANKIKVSLSCEQGICGTCLTAVLDGVPDHRDMYLTNSEKAANNQIILCCSRAKTSKLLLDI
jgi:vanillate O-demethylase ferredoxin subunit